MLINPICALILVSGACLFPSCFYRTALDGDEREEFNLLQGDRVSLKGELFRPDGEEKTYFKRIYGVHNNAKFEVNVDGLHIAAHNEEVVYDFDTGFVSFGDLSFRSEKSVMGSHWR